MSEAQQFVLQVDAKEETHSCDSLFFFTKWWASSMKMGRVGNVIFK